MLLTGLVCGAVLAGLYLGYKENEPGHFGSGIRSLLEREPRPEQPAASPPEQAPEPVPEVTLDFHQLLPNIDELLSEADLITDEADEALSGSGQIAEEEPVAARPEHEYEYALQAGSYRSERDAEGMKAKLLLAGFEPVIQRVKIRSKGTYYRVRLGPYQSKRELNADKRRLAEHGVHAMALRLKEPG